MTTLLLAEHDNKSLKDSTNKALTAAKQLGGDVHVLVAGKDAKAAADAAAKLDGVKKVLLADGISRLTGRAGEWLVDYGDGSLGIVSEAIFAATYDIIG